MIDTTTICVHCGEPIDLAAGEWYGPDGSEYCEANDPDIDYVEGRCRIVKCGLHAPAVTA